MYTFAPALDPRSTRRLPLPTLFAIMLPKTKTTKHSIFPTQIVPSLWKKQSECHPKINRVPASVKNLCLHTFSHNAIAKLHTTRCKPENRSKDGLETCMKTKNNIAPMCRKVLKIGSRNPHNINKKQLWTPGCPQTAETIPSILKWSHQPCHITVLNTSQ